MRGRIAELVGREDGIAIVQLALLSVVLTLFTAFAVDLGWFFVNASRVQRAADAAALAGVVYMPDDEPFAIDRAERVAEANGYVDGLEGAALTIAPKPDGNANQLEVTVTDTVETFFLRVIGKSTQTIARTGRAEFIKPLPLGSPESGFGNDGVDGVDCAGADPCFWANIHGRYTNTGMGDAFSSFCTYGQGWGSGSPQTSNCDEGLDHRSSRGYVYGIEHTGGNLTLQIQNGSFEQGGGDGVRTGDGNAWCAGEICEPGPSLQVRVYAPDPTPLTLDPAGILCTRTYDPIPTPADPSMYSWDTVCSFAAAPGLYTAEVSVVDDAGTQADDAGLNRYALRVGAGDSISALGDMSIFNNISGNTEFFLARVDSFYAGRTFVVELYDPGDAEAGVPNIIKLLQPGGATWTGGCDISIREHLTTDFVALETDAPGSDCDVDATRPAFNYDGDWVRIEVNLPEDYTCADCWWKIRYEYQGSAADTTTWKAFISGSPVRLILGG